MTEKSNIAVLIPAFNEEKTIAEIVMHCAQYGHPVIVVDDGSTDGTAAVLQNVPATVLRTQDNCGKGATLLRGFQFGLGQQYAGVVTLDADGQHNPADLPQFFELINNSPSSLIIGARTISTEEAPKKRLWANKAADFFVSWAVGLRVYDTQSGFRYYPAKFLNKLIKNNALLDRFVFETDILIKAISDSFSLQYVDIQSCYPKTARASHFRDAKDTWQITRLVAKELVSKGLNLPGLWRVIHSS